MEISIYSTIIFIVVIIEISLAVVVFSRSTYSSARLFSGLVLVHTVWVMVEALFHATTSPAIAYFAVMLSHFLGGILASLFYLFTLSYPDSRTPKIKPFLLVAGANILLLLAYGQGLIIKEVFEVPFPQGWGWHWGSLSYLFHIVFFGFWTAGLYQLFSRSQRAQGRVETNLRMTLYAMILTVLPISVATIILPMFNIFSYAWVGSIASLIWVAGLAYSTFHLRKSNVRAVLSEILVLAAGIILFINIFISESSDGLVFISSDVVLRVIVFVAFFVFIVGYLLIVSIIKETEQKEQIESLNNELTQLNVKLEDKVADRTKALNSSRKHTEVILENLTIGILEYDSNFNVLQINKVAEQLLGVDRSKVLHKKIAMKDSGTNKSLSKIMYDWQSEVVTSEDGGEVTYNELTLTYPKYRELQVITIPIRIIPFMKITGFVKLIRDVTLEKTVDRGKSDFIAIVAHQLSTPLEATGWAISKVLEEQTTEKQLDLLRKIQTSNKNLTQIAADLLVAARIDASEYTPRKEKNSIVETINKQIDFFGDKAREKNIALSFQQTSEDIPPFYFDHEQISLALRNVLSNALDYTPGKGKVTVTLTRTSDGYVSIVVTDTGIGIPQDELDRLFTKFYRSKEALLMETDRSGLGLYITKHIIDSHNGVITLSSEQGKGVTVRMKIPLATQKEWLNQNQKS